MLGNGHSMFVKVSFMNVCKHHPSSEPQRLTRVVDRWIKDLYSILHIMI